MSTKTATIYIWDVAYGIGVGLVALGVGIDGKGGIAGSLVIAGIGIALWAAVRAVVAYANS